MKVFSMIELASFGLKRNEDVINTVIATKQQGGTNG